MVFYSHHIGKGALFSFHCLTLMKNKGQKTSVPPQGLTKEEGAKENKPDPHPMSQTLCPRSQS